MHVLVVDDEPSVTSLVGTWLTDAGYRVTAATTFKGAVAEMKIQRLDAIVVDVRLGEFNGLQLALSARRQNPDVRIVVISGWDDPVLRREALECGATYLAKPFTASELLGAVESSAARGWNQAPPAYHM
jgi:two-component system, NtrC family, response regulator HydG